MTLTETGFEGLIVLEPRIFEDQRGFFMESYNQKTLAGLGINKVFVQDNHSKSSKGVIRGLHFQNRKNSATFGKHFSIEISEDNKKQLLIPPGFAHGFTALTDDAQILYKCDQFYNAESEGGLLYNDPELNIDWKIDLAQAIVSEKDKVHPGIKDLDSTF